MAGEVVGARVGVARKGYVMKPLPPEKAHLQALFDAYVEATGLQISLSPTRERTLREFDRRGISPEDVRWVLVVLKGRVDRGVSGYTAASLEWLNAMADVDRFEDRLATLRQERARRKAKARPREVVQTVRRPDGSTVAATLPTPEADAQRISDAVKRQAEELRRKLTGGSGS